MDANQIIESGFTIYVPREIKFEEAKSAEDFKLYYFFNAEGRQILGVYFGQHPDFPSDAAGSRKVKSCKVGNRTAKFVTWEGQKKLHNGDYLIKRRKNLFDFHKTYAHFFYVEIDQGDVVLANLIMGSIRLTEH